jgi:hypothetical protein
MAGKITHLEVLTQATKHLAHGSPEQKEISELLSHPLYKKYANFGSIAPDIFYYYHIFSPIRSTKAQFWGDIHHHRRVIELILNFLDLCMEAEEETTKNKLMAFTYGYICHCAVDIVTHPYIFYISGDYYNKDPKIASTAQMNHLRVEFALDSYLLNYRWGMSPKTYDFVQYIDIQRKGFSRERKIDPLIWMFWQTALSETFPDEFESNYLGSNRKIIPGDVLNESYLGFIDFHRVLDSRSLFMRGLLKILDTVTFNKIKTSVLVIPMAENIDQRIMNEEKRPWNYPADPRTVSRESFIELVNRASMASKDAMTLAFNYLLGNEKREKILKEYSGYNLDTGLRHQGVDKMKKFSPLKEQG